MIISLIFMIGFLYFFSAIILFFNAKKANLFLRIRRSYNPDFSGRESYVFEKQDSQKSRSLNFISGINEWLSRNDVKIDAWSLIIPFLVFISLLFIACLFIRMGIFIFSAATVAAFMFVFILIDYRGRKINIKKENQLEEFLLDLVANLYANPNILACLQKTCREALQPLKKEFEMVIEDTRKGARLNEALENLLKRNRSAIIQVIITGLIAANEKGVDLIEFLKDQLDYLREKKSIENYVRILSTGPRYVSYVIAGIPFMVLIIASLLNKDFAESLFKGTGLYILIYSFLSYFTGFLLINKITNLADNSDKNIK